MEWFLDAETREPRQGHVIRPRRVRLDRLYCTVGLSQFVLEVAICILSLTNLNVNLAVAWIFRRKRRGLPPAPHVTREACTFILEEFALIADMGFILDACSREDSPFQAALKIAKLAVRCHDMEQYVLRANRQHGTVVTSSDFIQRWNKDKLPTVMNGAVVHHQNPVGDKCGRNAASQSVRRWQHRTPL